MEFKVIVDICTVIGATGVIFAVLTFFYKKAKNIVKKLQDENKKLKVYTANLLAKITNNIKRNEIYSYLKLLVDQQNKFLIETRLTINLLLIINLMLTSCTLILTAIKLDEIPNYSEHPSLFISLLIASVTYISTFIFIFCLFLLLKQAEQMQASINGAYIKHVREHIENKYLKDET